MNNRIRLIRISLFLICTIALVLLSGCPDTSVLTLVKNAQKQIDLTLNNNLTIIAEDTDGTYYYIACGTSMYMRPIAPGSSWTGISFPNGAVGCTALAYYSGNLYAGFVFGNGSGNLYYSTTPAISWTAVTDINVINKQVIKLIETNGQLLVSTCVVSGGTASDYSLYYWSAPNAYLPTGLMSMTTPISAQVISVCWLAPDYWVATENGIYRMTGLGGTPAGTEPGIPAASYGGMLISANNNFFISTTSGHVYSAASTDLTTWTPHPHKST
jgi:hypothetical protein